MTSVELDEIQPCDGQANSDSKQWVIYAFGTQPPSDTVADAGLVQHLDYGLFELDLTKPLPASSPPDSTTNSPSDAGTTTPSPTDDIPLLPYQRIIVAHAIFCIVGFLVLLPVGALLARYLRTFTSTWFTGHWVTQFAIGMFI